MTYSFSVAQHVHRASVLYQMRDYLGVGRVVQDTDTTKIKYIVTNTQDMIKTIVPLFVRFKVQNFLIMKREKRL